MASNLLDSFLNKLTCVTYNCEYADDSRLSFLKELYQQSDFLLLQEHGLFKTDFGWFDKLGVDVGKHGVSAMDESKILKGRPNGGAAIIWKGSLNAKVIPVIYESRRVCAVTAELSDTRILIV
jgi:hypothetical protein